MGEFMNCLLLFSMTVFVLMDSGGCVILFLN